MHYEIAVNLDNLAAIRQSQGETADAERLYRRAAEIKETILGPDHPDLGFTLYNLATLFASSTDPVRLDEATALYERALEIFEHALGPDSPAHGDLPGARRRSACHGHFLKLQFT